MIVKNSFYNLLGFTLPLLVAMLTIPILIGELGNARFGLLTLIWAVVSYFGLFDLGLGRALTHSLATAIGKNETEDVGRLTATALTILLGLGTLMGGLMALFGPAGVGFIKSVPDQGEVVRAMYFMAIALPAIVLTSGLRGALESTYAFGIINVIRLSMGLITFIGPLAVIYAGKSSLDWIAAILSLARYLQLIIYLYVVTRKPLFHLSKLKFSKNLVRPLCLSGGWISVSNVVSPLMGYADRFLIGALISAEAVAYYSTSNEIITKLGIIPGALTAVLFPTFASQSTDGLTGTKPLFAQAVQWVYIILLPISLVICLFASEILSFWIGEDFALRSAVLLQVFAVGILINSITHIPFTLIQGVGRARQTAFVHIGIFPFYIPAVWWATVNFGLIGTAGAWLLRILVDSALMFLLCSRVLDLRLSDTLNARSFALVVITGLAFSAVALDSALAKASIAFVATSLCILILPKVLAPTCAFLAKVIPQIG